ncbi:1-phosphatidylinositol phosphodiesterase [Striga asiatica]|uniref:1-phosphatidylinositol phosphodiesterase n=1 Tax=Striga asiatica TaxID=4170 RepID=A0A5A7QLX2_STRAF|nr:1-phosphatidylinositol phosphodiesterase [Striga asiatica]
MRVSSGKRWRCGIRTILVDLKRKSDLKIPENEGKVVKTIRRAVGSDLNIGYRLFGWPDSRFRTNRICESGTEEFTHFGNRHSNWQMNWSIAGNCQRGPEV